MREDVHLYIGGKEVNFKKSPDIYFNYAIDDLTNPTVVKNSYSKTVTIEGTPENNKVFGQFWDLERYQTDNDFNPSHKTPFTIYVNGEVYESGYVKLDKVKKTKNKIEYDITLYGGLGEFFYVLSYKDNGDKLKLADLDYTEEGGVNELDFTINKETVSEAWDVLDYSAVGTLWNIINFAPAYNGNPSNLSADKAVINMYNNYLPSAVTEDNVTYTARNGYALANLPEEMDEWAMRDLRSWNQRPVINIKKIFEAVERYVEPYGYSIDYDQDFFKTDNVYWNKMWMTLPKLDEIEIKGESDTPSYTFTPTLGGVRTINGWYNSIYDFDAGDIPLSTETLRLDMTPVLTLDSYSQWVYSGSGTLYTSCYVAGKKNFAGYLIQLVGYEGNVWDSTIVAASDAVLITSKMPDGEYLDISNEYGLKDNLAGYIKLGKNYTNVFGTFSKIGSTYDYEFSTPISLSMDNANNAASFGLMITAVANTEMMPNGSSYTFGDRRGRAYTSQNISRRITSGTSVNTVTLVHNRTSLCSQTTGATYSESETAGYSGAKLTKERLLNSEYSPCDYILSYAKLFGLYWHKEPDNKVIHIMTRGNYYNLNKVVDINDDIDRKDNVITPMSFNSKWYDMALKNVEGAYAKKYKTTYGREYGIQRINTGYNFDSNTTDLFKDNVLKSAVEVTDKNRYYMSPIKDYYNDVPAYYNQGMTYTLYNNEDSKEFTPSPISGISYPMKKRKYYDAFHKAHFRDKELGAIDGENVLLFFNGCRRQVNSNGDYINYYITDDLSVMGTLNDGQPCWISTEEDIDEDGNRIAISTLSLPHFGRYYDDESGDILLQSLDFGNPRELFIPDAIVGDDIGLYAKNWRKYISDLYDINTKIVECPVLFQSKPTNELLRDFYWFDNSIWRINSISEWKIGEDKPVKVKFVKVQDIQNYSNEEIKKPEVLKLSADSETITTMGGSVEFTVEAPDGLAWTTTDAWNEFLSAPVTGTGNGTFSVTFPPCDVDRIISLSVRTSSGTYSNTVRLTVVSVMEVEVIQPADNVIDPSGSTVVINVRSTSPWTGRANTEYGTPVISGGTGDYEWQRFEYRVDVNTTKNERSIYFIFTNEDDEYGYSDRMHQQPLYAIDAVAEPVTYPASGGTGTLTITANTSWEIEMEAIWGGVVYPDFLTLSQTGGTGNTVITVTCPETDMHSSRQEYIYVKKGDYTFKTLFISQLGTDYMTITPDEEIELSVSGTTYTRTLDTNVEGLEIRIVDEFTYDCKLDGVPLADGGTIPTGTHTLTFKINPETLEMGFRAIAMQFSQDTRIFGNIWIKHI